MNPVEPSGFLSIPKVRIITHGEASFHLYASSLRKSLPENLRVKENVDIFKRKFKTHLFSLAFNWT